MAEVHAGNRMWMAADVWQGLDASGATVAALPKLGERASWLLEPAADVTSALRILHADALDPDALVVASLGLPFQWTVAWAHSCVGSFAPQAAADAPAERALGTVGEWVRQPSDKFAWEALRLGAILGSSTPPGWLALSLARLIHPPGLTLEARLLAARFAVLAAVGLAASEADPDRFGGYPARLQLCTELALAVLGHA